MTKRFGFTLAEVLITLGIIGVVAAMTIPTLISNTNGAQFKTAYKKALSTLNQAVLMNIAMDGTDFSGLKADAEDSSPEGSLSNILFVGDDPRIQSGGEITNYFDDDVAGETLSIGAVTCAGDGDPVNVCKDTTAIAATEFKADNAKVYSLSDGTSFGYLTASADCTKENPCKGFIDVNGITGPNKETTSSDSASIQDIFPVVFYGQTVEPATEAARAVLFGK